MGRLADKTVIIRGCSPGSIGFGIARAFAHEGAKLVLVSHGKARGNAIRELRDSFGVRVSGFDIANDGNASIERTVQSIAGEFGSIDVLVNCALLSKAALLEELKAEDLRQCFETSTLDALSWMQACHHHLRMSKGCIFNLVSSSSREGMPALGSLAIASESLRAITNVAAEEWEQDGICALPIEAQARTEQLAKWAREFSDAYEAVAANVEFCGIDALGAFCVSVVREHEAAMH